MSIITTLIVSIGERKEKFFIRPTEMAKDVYKRQVLFLAPVGPI